MVGNVDEKTFRKWAWQFITAIADLEADVVSCQFDCVFVIVIYTNTLLILDLINQIIWENRKKLDKSNDCLTTVDGTDFRIPAWGRKFYSHKFKGSGLRYEVALSILGGGGTSCGYTVHSQRARGMI
jgi:hypothetical protein